MSSIAEKVMVVLNTSDAQGALKLAEYFRAQGLNYHAQAKLIEGAGGDARDWEALLLEAESVAD